MHRAHQPRPRANGGQQVRRLAAVGVDDIRRQVADAPTELMSEKRIAPTTGHVQRREAHAGVERRPVAFMRDHGDPFAKRRQAAGEVGEVRLQAARLVAAQQQADFHRCPGHR